MNIKRFILVALVFLFVFSGYQNLFAKEVAPQARIVLNAWKGLDKDASLYLRFVFPDIVGSHYPIAWFGFSQKFNKNFTCSVMVGKTLRKEDNTFILSAFPVFKFGKWSIWNEFDYNFTPKTGYNFTEIRYATYKDWLKVGIDNENVFGNNGFISISPAIDIVLTDHICITFSYFFKWVDSERWEYFRFYLKFF